MHMNPKELLLAIAGMLILGGVGWGLGGLAQRRTG